MQPTTWAEPAPLAWPPLAPSIPPIDTLNPSILPSLQADLTALLGTIRRLTEARPVPLGQWAAKVREENRLSARSTRRRMGQAVREAIAQAPEGATTAELTPLLVQDYAARLAETRKGSSVNALLRSLRTACNIAVKLGWLSADPVQPAEAWREEETRRKHHPREDIARVLAWLKAGAKDWKSRRLHALAALWAYTGLRRTEALRLKVADVNLQLGFVRVVRFRQPTKKCKTRSSEAAVPLPRALVAILRDWIPQSGCEWLFPGVMRRTPWTEGNTGDRPWDQLRKAGEACGVGGFTPHSLRHSLATHLRGWWGASKEQVRLMLRHGDLSSQEWYIGDDLINLRGLVRDFDFTAPRRLTPKAAPRKKARRPKVRLYRRRRVA